MTPNQPLSQCPHCAKPCSGLTLFPMSFRESDEARRNAALQPAGKRGRKRKNSLISSDEPGKNSPSDAGKTGEMSDRRTGRWTTEEMAYCDKLIEKFTMGDLPLAEGIKLNDFLANMLKSKQSRLTKKMKNAKLSSKTFKRAAGYIVDPHEAREVSELEDAFYLSIQDHVERAEVRFHMQKEWRELFSNYCVSISQSLDADAWLSSVEEMDRRIAAVKDAARMARRKLMTGMALNQDGKNPPPGVFIEHSEADRYAVVSASGALPGSTPSPAAVASETEEFLGLLSDKGGGVVAAGVLSSDLSGKNSLIHSAPFLGRVVAYLQRHAIPFEHVDAWVPSFLNNAEQGENPEGGETKCRLCYAGSATTDVVVPPDGRGPAVGMSHEEQFNLLAFGDYSQKFSFDVGCGLPGRVYANGVPTWEQSVQNAPLQHFERCGGAVQWGIKTVLGIAITSPNVGRIVVTLYSRYDRHKDEEMVGRLCTEFTKLMPSPRWKLVVDIGQPPPMKHEPTPAASTESSLESPTSDEKAKDNRIDEVVSLIGEFMPSDPCSPLVPYLPGFMSLRLLLLRSSRSNEDEDTVQTMLGSYASYSSGGRSRKDIAVMLARDYMFLTKIPTQQPQHHTVSKSPLVNASLAPGYSFFGVSNIDAPYHNSPAMTPIPASSNSINETCSIVST